MGTLTSFTFLTLDGYYKGLYEDISWHQHDREGEQYSRDLLRSGNTLLFGRTTYEMMAGFWPTSTAKQRFPVVAEGMNKALKLVVSNSLQSAAWTNTKIIRDNWIYQLKQLKEKSNITILGSGSIVTQLSTAGLIDQYQFMIDPLILGKGTSIFSGLKVPLKLKLKDSQVFSTGKLLITYQPQVE